MKTQQRSFVVEYKSARRQSTKQPRSIWGDTDFKALVKEVEAETPRLFEAGVTAESPSPHMESSIDVFAAELNHSSGAAVNLLDANSLTDDDETPEEIRRVKKEPARRIKKAAGRGHSAADQTEVQTSETRSEQPVDELATLEEENRQLKALLKQHLFQQNMQLRSMLERFDIA